MSNSDKTFCRNRAIIAKSCQKIILIHITPPYALVQLYFGDLSTSLRTESNQP